MSQETVRIWVDPRCPWAWLTSRWLIEVAKVRPIDIEWRVMSLALLNADKDITPEYRQRLEGAIGPVRVLTAVANDLGNQTLADLYTQVGTTQFPAGRDDYLAVLEGALAAQGLDARYLDAAHNEALDAQLRTSHEQALALVGNDVGTPVLEYRSVGIFGPVISDVPTGEAAGRLWDAVWALAEYPDFWELKRTRTKRPNLG